MPMLTASVLLLAFIGLAISTYFTGVAYRWIAPDARWVPPVCRMDEGTCASVVHTPRARVFGLPNSLLGQLWYAALIGGALGGLLHAPGWQAAYLLGAAATVALGIYLTWSLLFITRVNCRLCFASHAINLLLLLLLVAGR